jgi:dolichol-phosphate mannosyltransferase
VIIPTYNERTTLPVLVKRLGLLRPHVSLELVIIDDDSPDGTGAVADALAREESVPMTVVHRSGKGGLASAILAGAAAAHAPILTVMDSDLSHPPEFLPTLLAAMTDEVDIAIASRYVPGGGIDRWPLYRRAVSYMATKLVQIALGLRVHDPVSGFFAVRRDLLLDQPYAAMGYKILTEILARHPESRVVEVPYRFTDRQGGTSKLSSSEITTFARLIWRLRRRR